MIQNLPARAARENFSKICLSCAKSAFRRAAPRARHITAPTSTASQTQLSIGDQRELAHIRTRSWHRQSLTSAASTAPSRQPLTTPTNARSATAPITPMIALPAKRRSRAPRIESRAGAQWRCGSCGARERANFPQLSEKFLKNLPGRKQICLRKICLPSGKNPEKGLVASCGLGVWPVCIGGNT